MGNVRNRKLTSQKIVGEIGDSKAIKGWGNYVAWAPDGKSFTVLTHSNHLYQYSINLETGGLKKMSNSKMQYLPLKKCVYIDQNTLVAGGYDNVLMHFARSQDQW